MARSNSDVQRNVAYSQALGDTTSVAAISVVSWPEDRIRCAAIARADWVRRTFTVDLTGGNLLTVLQTELLFPMPEKFRIARVSVCFLTWVMCSDRQRQFVGTTDANGTAARRLPTSAMMTCGVQPGFAVQGWLRLESPLQLRNPTQRREAAGVNYGDEREGFQFSIGRRSNETVLAQCDRVAAQASTLKLAPLRHPWIRVGSGA